MRLFVSFLKTMRWIIGWIWASLLWDLRGMYTTIDCEGRFIEFTDAETRLTSNWPARRYSHCFIREEIANSPLSDDGAPYLVTHYLGRFKTSKEVIEQVKQLETLYEHNRVGQIEAAMHNLVLRDWVELIVV